MFERDIIMIKIEESTILELQDAMRKNKITARD